MTPLPRPSSSFRVLRTKAIKRKLREVEALPTDQAAALLPDMNEFDVVDDD